MSKLNWAKLERERRLNYRPAQRARPATPRQTDYIRDLAHQKGHPKPRMPRTVKGASDMIDRLLALPDTDEPLLVRPEPQRTDDQELLTELRQRFPQFSPITVNSMINLFSQLDELGMAFTFDAVMNEETPEATDELILFILRRFLDAFAPVSTDEPALVAG